LSPYLRPLILIITIGDTGGEGVMGPEERRANAQKLSQAFIARLVGSSILAEYIHHPI